MKYVKTFENFNPLNEEDSTKLAPEVVKEVSKHINIKEFNALCKKYVDDRKTADVAVKAFQMLTELCKGYKKSGTSSETLRKFIVKVMDKYEFLHFMREYQFEVNPETAEITSAEAVGKIHKAFELYDAAFQAVDAEAKADFMILW